jgi:hypothetical protein
LRTMTVVCSAAQAKFWNLPTSNSKIKFILCRAAKLFSEFVSTEKTF